MLSRRNFLRSIAATAALVPCARLIAAGNPRPTIGLGFSLYGMKTLSIGDALRTCADVGYDCVELPVMADWPADCAKLNADARRDLRVKLADGGLRLTALMENLPALGDDAQHKANLERLKLACELSGDLAAAPHAPPLIETILGGKAGTWPETKNRLAARAADLARIAEKARVPVAVKAHVGNAMQRPEQLVWLLDQVASPWLAAAYDYSHFQLQDLPLAGTLDALLPRTRFVHVKDTEHAQGKRGFLLPGEGTIDYADLFRRLAAGGYRGDVVVEVSSQLFNKSEYDPLVACRKCYNHLAPAREKAGVRRG
jgi:sugar phosphate isomerase/epimerase